MMNSVARTRGVSPGSGCVMASGTVTMEGTRQRDSARVSNKIMMLTCICCKIYKLNHIEIYIDEAN